MNEGSKLHGIVNEVYHLVRGKNVLDVGTGFGTVVTKLLEDDRLKIVSIDPEAWHFDDIQEEFATHIKSGRLKLEKTGVEKMPFTDGEFNTTISICSLHHVADPVKGMREIERVTSNRIIITDWSPASSGVHNPHSSRELELNRQRIVSYGMESGYNTEERGDWFLVWK